MPGLNCKDKEILIECLDYDGDGTVGKGDIAMLMDLCGSKEENNIRNTQQKRMV